MAAATRWGRGWTDGAQHNRLAPLGASLPRPHSAWPPSRASMDAAEGQSVCEERAGGGPRLAKCVALERRLGCAAQPLPRRGALWGGRNKVSAITVVSSLSVPPPLRALPTPSCRRPESCDHWRRGGGVQKLGQLGRHPWAERGAESRGPRGRLAGEHRGAPAAGWGRFRVTDASPSEAQG